MTSKLSFLTSVAAGALALGMAAAPASAFDKVNWQWNLEVKEVVKKDIDIDVDVDPSGMVLLENIQVQVGDVTSTSIVNGVYNNQYVPNGGTVTIDELFDVSGDYEEGGVPVFESNNNPIKNVTIVGDGDTGGLNVSYVPSATDDVNEIGKNFEFDIAVTGTITVDPSGTFDARTELPEVVSAATAVGNNSSIDSEVMVEVHEGQFLFDTAEGHPGLPEGLAALAIYDLFANNHGEINTHHLVGAATLVGAVGGLIDKAEISAVSKVSNILNATVDSSATAVGNNKSITIEPRTWADSIMIGDVTQVSVANVTALSEVSNVSLNSYTNLGKLDRPIVNSVATAVGNNLSVSVKAPSVD